MRLDQSGQDKNNRGGASRPLKILVVEDEAELRHLMVEGLRREGHEVLAAENGEEALLKLAGVPSWRVDVLVTDVIMPEMGGVKLAVEVLARYPAVKILLHSGYPEDDLDRSALAGKPAAFLEKPFTRPELIAAIARIVDENEKVV